MNGTMSSSANTALNVSCHPQHGSSPKGVCEASCLLSLAAPDDDLPRPPLSLTLTFDVGSGCSEFIRCAVEAAINLVDWMGPNDRVGIVAFSSQAWEVLQLTPATPSGRDMLRDTIRSLCCGAIPPLFYPSDPFPDQPSLHLSPAPLSALSDALLLSLSQQRAVRSANPSPSSSLHSSTGPASFPSSPAAPILTYTPLPELGAIPTHTTAPGLPSSDPLSNDSSHLIRAAYPSSICSSSPKSLAMSPCDIPASGHFHRPSDDSNSGSVSSGSSSVGPQLQSVNASPPPLCRSMPLVATSCHAGSPDTALGPPFSHTAFLHTVPEYNGGSDDEFDDEGPALPEAYNGAAAGQTSTIQAIHSTAVFLLTPGRPTHSPPAVTAADEDDPVTRMRRFSACAAPRHHYVPVTAGSGAKSTLPLHSESVRAAPQEDLPYCLDEPTAIRGTKHSLSHVPAHVYNPLADPSLDTFDPAAAPRSLSVSPFLPTPIYAFGVGGSYDPEALSDIAAATGGVCQHVAAPHDLSPALAAAFGAASAAFAADVEIRVTPLCGSSLVSVHTGYPVWVEGHDVVVHIPEVAARMQKDLLVTFMLPQCTPEERAVDCVKFLAGVASVSFMRARTGIFTVRKSCIVLPRMDVLGSGRGFGKPDPAVVTEHMRLAAAQACADALRLCHSGSHGAAQKKILKLRAGIKQLQEVCKASLPRCSDSRRCSHARMLLAHVIMDLSAAAAAVVSPAAFDASGHAILHAIERSHACQLPQAPASCRRAEAAVWPKGSVLRMLDASEEKSRRCSAATAAHAEPPALVLKSLSAMAPRDTSAAHVLAQAAASEQASPRAPRPVLGKEEKVKNMLRRICQRVRSSRGAKAPADSPTEGRQQGPPPLKTPPAPTPADSKHAQEAQHSEYRKLDAKQIVGVRVSAYTCEAQMALVAAAVRRMRSSNSVL